MKRFIWVLSVLFMGQLVNSQDFELFSPEKNLKVHINIGKSITWLAVLDGKTVIDKTEIAMDFSSGIDFGIHPKLAKHQHQQHSALIHPVISYKDSEIIDEYNLLTFSFKGKYKLEFRAFNDGIAYRFIDENKAKRQVITETMNLSFPTGTRSLFPKEESMYSHNERFYHDVAISDLKTDEFCSLPVMFSGANGKVLFTETALLNYPGMFLQKTDGERFNTLFPKYVLEALPNPAMPDRDQLLTKKANYIAQVNGRRAYPWRVFIIGQDESVFVESNLTYQLANPTAIKNTDWIKPGKVAWDWYNANNITGVDFKSGLNTATYKYYIDFASANNIEYVILDEGWTKSTTEILEFNPDMDVEEIIRYGESKNVGIILWVLWKPLDENMDEILKTYKSWGAKGIKVDFMQRNDQYMVNSYEQIAKTCAQYELLVNFHGAFKPIGLRRMYPNVLNYEGVKGSENNKWSNEITPKHNVTIPFIRMAAGPMDYTPGAMRNARPLNYAESFERPMSLGTRAHQVAMYVIYEAPLQMMCESPSIYYKEQETVDFITQIPTTWDETKVLKGAVGEYIAVARRKGDTWYIGAMTNWDKRELQLDLSFLSEGKYQMQIFKDGINAERNAEDYKIEQKETNSDNQIVIDLASGGGWTAIIKKN
ncbi:glycoside hydrolase family 97 protein [Carboxylicivirga sp. A043]|uniref:glycoside hydrolase family 97 protein n=1 Tax=Carboxylicivirga litoralis TaxID=2816963 RepID=UPI0021CB69C5|nr:glycoside hydrolase family 97 protein [Carboxylicivirga sp. A043]MCU4157273.1 glycoside hydrolase family 97 protein [Carboxylicivirga sp. A043]